MSPHRPLSQIDSLVIYCAATPNGRWTTVEDIDRRHGPDREARGLRPFLCRSGSPWQMPHLKHVGYHFVIYTNGAVTGGRRGLTSYLAILTPIH
jgi:N-acetylmuramoyl-L-alanine amidase